VICDLPFLFTFLALQSSRIDHPAEATLPRKKALAEADLRPRGVSVTIRAPGSPLEFLQFGAAAKFTLAFTTFLDASILIELNQ
jgi:hypothetical protein